VHGEFDQQESARGSDRQLKERAKRNRRSLNQEAIVELAAFREWPNAEDESIAKTKERIKNANERIDQSEVEFLSRSLRNCWSSR